MLIQNRERSSTAAAGQAVGIGRVLAGVRQPGEVREPHVVEFRDVTKTFNAGTIERIHGDSQRHVRG